jgi:hypothetical protein
MLFGKLCAQANLLDRFIHQAGGARDVETTHTLINSELDVLGFLLDNFSDEMEEAEKQPWPDGLSPDDPTQESPDEREERERKEQNRGFYGR